MLCDFVPSFSWNESPHQFLLLSTPFLSTPLLGSHRTPAPITTRLPLTLGHAPAGRSGRRLALSFCVFLHGWITSFGISAVHPHHFVYVLPPGWRNTPRPLGL